MKRKLLLYILAVIGLTTVGTIAVLAWLLYPKWEPTGPDPLPQWRP